MYNALRTRAILPQISGLIARAAKNVVKGRLRELLDLLGRNQAGLSATQIGELLFTGKTSQEARSRNLVKELRRALANEFGEEVPRLGIQTTRGRYRLDLISEDLESNHPHRGLAKAAGVLRLVEAMCDLQSLNEPERSDKFFGWVRSLVTHTALTAFADQFARHSAGQPNFANMLLAYPYLIQLQELQLVADRFGINRLLLHPFSQCTQTYRS